ncbi:MAG: hypothetical protein EOP04_24000 [Proteobacteria bacterium]|nr:MAG: hypothetical protein EOP04_24000 [Pseudomonadota bacterium]
MLGKYPKLFVTGLFLAACSTASSKDKPHVLPEVERQLSAVYPNERRLEVNDLSEDAKKSFLEMAKGKEPGVICGPHGRSLPGCAVLLVNKGKNPVSTRVIYFWKDGAKLSSEQIEDFRKDKVQRDNVFLIAHPKANIENRGDGPDKILMSNDGVQRIIEGQSSMVFYFEDGKVKKIWTAD